MNQLQRLFGWFQAKADALETKESALAQKMREEQLKKRMEMKKKIMEQQSMTYFPPIKKGQREGKALSGRETNPMMVDKPRPNNLLFSVSRNNVLANSESTTEMQLKASPAKKESLSPIKASYQSVAILQ